MFFDLDLVEVLLPLLGDSKYFHHCDGVWSDTNSEFGFS